MYSITRYLNNWGFSKITLLFTFFLCMSICMIVHILEFALILNFCMPVGYLLRKFFYFNLEPLFSEPAKNFLYVAKPFEPEQLFWWLSHKFSWLNLKRNLSFLSLEFGRLLFFYDLSWYMQKVEFVVAFGIRKNLSWGLGGTRISK